MNVFKLGGVINTLKHDIAQEEPRVVAWFGKVQTELLPIEEAVLALLVKEGAVTLAQVEKAKAIFAEGLALEKEFEPIIAAVMKGVE